MDHQETKPIRLILHRYQGVDDIKKLLLDAHKAANEIDGLIEVFVEIRGFEGDARHPALIKDAKKCYSTAIEEGLLGFLAETGHQGICSEMYCMAYIRGRTKMQNGNRVVRFNKVDADDFTRVSRKSMMKYMELISSVDLTES